MTTDEHQRERIRAWVAFACTPDGDSDRFNAEFADGMLAEFDKRFPAPSAAAPVEPVPAGYKFSIGPQIASVDSFTGSTCTVQTIDVAELTALRRKARLWDAVASGKVRIDYNLQGTYGAFYGPIGKGKRTDNMDTAEEAVEAAIAAGALK